MKAAISQSNPRIGDLAANTKKIVDAIEAAKRAEAKLVVFPELTTTGYTPRDLLRYDELVDANLKALERAAASARGITAICGFIERNPSRLGKPYFNSAAILQEGRVAATYRKQLLPYYDVFDEERYFEPGPDQACIVAVDGKRIAVTICEDAWNSEHFLRRPYPVRPIERVAREKPDLLVNISASPFHVGKPALRERLFREAAESVGAPVLFCNQVGGDDELLFDGCSFVIAPNGAFLAKAKAFEEDLVVFDLGGGSSAQSSWPSDDAEWLVRALVMGTRDYVHKSGATKVCLGLSGGVDSSVVAAIAVEALGAQNVACLSLPSRFTAGASEEDAASLAAALGISCTTLSIDPLFQLFQDRWLAAFGRKLAGVSLENVQPRLRMAFLMGLANDSGSLLLNTSNKSEIATGYATLYGDSAGALAVLGDLTKRQVYAVARYLNRGRKLIPERVLTRPPTAELRENQTDQDSLPPYDTLDTLVDNCILRSHGYGKMVASGLPRASVDRFAKLHAASEYKRHQLPPVLRVSPRSFGMGRRIPLASVKPWEAPV